MTCIYCRSKTRGDESKDHPIPQALGTSRYALPRGAVCDLCNGYLSSLDQNLCNHHHLAGLIVFGQLPGTDGRRRKMVAPGFTFDTEKSHLESRGGRAEFEDGVLAIRDDGNTRFDAWKFSRGLHRVALGTLALLDGPDRALEPAYDPVRRYIRQPASRAEFWPYSQRPSDRVLGNRSFPAAVRDQGFKLSFASRDSETFVYLHLFVSEFVVALAGDVRTLTDAVRQEFARAADVPDVGLSQLPWLLFDDAAPRPQTQIDFEKRLGPLRWCDAPRGNCGGA